MKQFGKVILDIKDAIKVERNPWNHNTYTFKCANPECNNEIRPQAGYVKKCSGYCSRCAALSKPFSAMYKNFKHQTIRKNKREFNLSYEEFLEFTKEDKCHYCHDHIDWYPYSRKNGEICRDGMNYRLDRKNNDIGYIKDNLIVCCWDCNNGKAAKYSYEDWYGMTEYFRRKRSGI